MPLARGSSHIHRGFFNLYFDQSFLRLKNSNSKQLWSNSLCPALHESPGKGGALSSSEAGKKLVTGHFFPPHVHGNIGGD